MTEEMQIALAIFSTLLMCVNAEVIGKHLGVMAIPDARRCHEAPTPQLGGMAILTGFAVWTAAGLIANGRIEPFVLTIFLSAAGLGAVGFVDDQRHVRPELRILLLVIFMAVAFALDPALISPSLNWYSFAAIQVSFWVYLPLMALASIGVVNAVNMADGQNGLVGSMFVVWTGCIAILGDPSTQAIAVVLCVLAFCFLIFNVRGKIFLGDCGTYGVTFAIGLLAVMLHAGHRLPLETAVVWFFIPIMDCLRLMVMRPLRGRSWFDGGRDHFHHLLIDCFGMRWSAAVYVGAVASTSIFATIEPRFSLVTLCILCGFYFSFARFSEGESVLAANPGQEDEGKVVSLTDKKRRVP